ncbi:MAG: cell division protein ZapA [Clostridia bacterium]|nr:cell division protein ZapA [Clostridia bacterium]
MEEKTKRKVTVNVAGIEMSFVTDEADSFVNTVVSSVDESMTGLLTHNMKCSQLDAAMLTAIAFCGDKITAEKRVRNLEAQISLYDVNMRRMRDEIAFLKKQLGGKDADSQLAIDDEPAPASEAAEEPAKEEAPATMADKLSQIESLLRRDK